MTPINRNDLKELFGYLRTLIEIQNKTQKQLNVLNQILLSSQLGENLRNTPIDKAEKISEHYKNLLNKLK